jgi:predicted polyphosphate/ATP-dependent NAD kinase
LSNIKVGIIANPVSARDIRRIISHAGNLPINDRANILLRMLAGLYQSGVREVLIMPENGGIRTQLMRTIQRETNFGTTRFPNVQYLTMPVTGTADDSALAARMMREAGVASIVVLGGDGTNRVVVSQCGNIPVAGVSTGTNNAFPEMREPTITGLAVGLAVTGQIPVQIAFCENKRIDVMINDRHEIALVDVAVVSDRFVGSRAIWKVDSFRDLFATFGLPEAIGMSSIVGLLAPVSRTSPEGRHVRILPAGEAPHHITVPIAPGLLEQVGIAGVEAMLPGTTYYPSISSGTLAFDGEREVTFSEIDDVRIRLTRDAFRSVNIPACMAHAAAHGLFVSADLAAMQSTQSI